MIQLRIPCRKGIKYHDSFPFRTSGMASPCTWNLINSMAAIQKTGHIWAYLCSAIVATCTKSLFVFAAIHNEIATY